MLRRLTVTQSDSYTAMSEVIRQVTAPPARGVVRLSIETDMTNEDETEAYLDAELDKFQAAIAQHDTDDARRVLEHVRAEAGDQAAAVIDRMLKERGLSSLLPPPPGPPVAPTKRPVESPPESPRRGTKSSSSC